MSIDSRAIQFGKIFKDWSIRGVIGQGSGGKNAVFKLARTKFGYEEISAMKVINIIEENGSYEAMSDEYKAAYDSACEELWHKAEEEIRLMYRLRGNVNIVGYLDCECADWVDVTSFGRDLLIRMDYFDNLRNRMKQMIFSEQEIIRIGKDICNALIACHEIKIWHRDIKPDNIFINQYNNYMLGDFGISKMVEECNSVETLKGTKAYAPPEQFAGRYDHRIDIYSLGLTLYELANSNRLPFAKSTYIMEKEIQMRLEGNWLPRIDRVSDKLNNVILRACEYNPDKRFQSAKEFLEALSAIKVSEMLKDVSVQTEEKVVQNTLSQDYTTVPLQSGEGDYTTVPLQSGEGDYTTVPLQTGEGDYTTIPLQTGEGDYTTVPLQTGEGAYTTVPLQTGEGDYTTVPLQTGEGAFTTVPLQTGEGDYTTVPLQTGEGDYTTVPLPASENFEKKETSVSEANIEQSDIEKPQLWYAKKTHNKIKVKLQSVNLEPKEKTQKTTSKSLWYGKKK